MKNAKYTNEELIKILINKSIELGRTPIMADIYGLSRIICYRFGTWNNALKIANLKPTYNKLTDEELKQIVINKYNELGRIPKKNDFINPAYATIRNRLGCIRELFNVKTIEKYENISDLQLLNKIRKIKKETGKYPLYSEMKNPTGYVYAKRFGSWKNALKLTGLKSDFNIIIQLNNNNEIPRNVLESYNYSQLR